jgi:HK97 family phage major capsid protein
MHRQTLIALLKAQIAASQFQTFVTFGADGSAKLLGYDVEFSSQMPVYQASPAVDGSILFGDFAAGWVIGDRGGSAIRAKVRCSICPSQRVGSKQSNYLREAGR